MKPSATPTPVVAEVAPPRKAKAIQPASAEFMNYKSAEAHFGLCHTRLYELVKDGTIESVLEKKKPCSPSGKRLLYAPSIRAYLTGLLPKKETAEDATRPSK